MASSWESVTTTSQPCNLVHQSGVSRETEPIGYTLEIHRFEYSTLNSHWKDWCWSWSSSSLAIWCQELTHWKRPWCLERLKAKGEEGGRRQDGWIASLTQWTWTWANSERQWGTGRPGMLQSMGSQRVRHDFANEQQQQQRDTQKKVHYKKLACGIRESEKSHDLLPIWKLEPQENPWCSSSPNPKTWKPGKPAVCVPAQVQRQEGKTRWGPRTGDGRPNSNEESRFALLPPFCSIRVLNRLDEACPRWWGWSFYSLLIQMLISSRNSLTDTPRNNMLRALWASLSLVRLTPKSNHHTWSRWQPSQNEMVHIKGLAHAGCRSRLYTGGKVTVLFHNASVLPCWMVGCWTELWFILVSFSPPLASSTKPGTQ